MMASFDKKQLVIACAEKLTQVPDGMKNFHTSIDIEGKLVIDYKPSADSIQDILNAVGAAGLTVRDLTTCEPNLEDIFLSLVHHPVAA